MKMIVSIDPGTVSWSAVVTHSGSAGMIYDDAGRRFTNLAPSTPRYPGDGNRLARRTAAAKRKGGGK